MGYFTCGQRTRLGSRLLSNSVPELPPTATLCGVGLLSTICSVVSVSRKELLH